MIESNHVFVGNTRVASIVKHKDETQPATYYYASDHLGSSSVLTTQTGDYHERIEYLPYGEVWVEDSAQSGGYNTPYKFTGKELDRETNLYYFGARYYDARVGRWISTDPVLEKYLPKPNDYDTEHDFYWYILNDASSKLPGMGGVFNTGNLDVYCYSLNNPVKYFDPDGKQTVDPEVFKQLIMSDPLIQLVKGIFEGDEAAKYAVKMGTIEVGIKAGDAMNDIGTAMIIAGLYGENPAVVITGNIVDTSGNAIKIMMLLVKSNSTNDSSIKGETLNELASEVAGAIIGNISKDVMSRIPGGKEAINKMAREMFSDKKVGSLKNIDKKAAKMLVEKVTGDSGKFIIKKAFKIENAKKK